MLVSLKLTVLSLEFGHPITVLCEVGGASGVWSWLPCNLLPGASFNVVMKEAVAALPSAKRIKRASMKQETRVAEDMGGRRQSGSGAVACKRGDGRVIGKYRIENKLKLTKGIRITREELSKIRSECEHGEVPLFEVDFADRTTLRVEDRWILVPYDHWKKVSGEADDDR